MHIEWILHRYCITRALDKGGYLDKYFSYFSMKMCVSGSVALSDARPTDDQDVAGLIPNGSNYSQTCIKQAPMRKQKTGCLKQVLA